MTGWHEGPLLAFDTETTGVDPRTARIVQIGTGRIEPGKIPALHTQLLDPGVEIPDGAAAVHGLTTEHCREHGQQPAEALAQVGIGISAWLSHGWPLVAMNAAYDCTLLQAELARHDLPLIPDMAPVIDPFVIDKHVDPYRRGKRTLQALCDYYRVTLDGAHDAGHDAMAAARVAWRIGQRYPQIAAMSLPDLHAAQQVWAREQADSLRAYFDRQGTAHDGVDGTWPVRSAPAEVAA